MDEQMGVWLHSSGSFLGSEMEKQFLAQPNTVLKETNIMTNKYFGKPVVFYLIF